MPQIRRRFRIVIDGEDPFEVQTNALDLVKSERDGQGPIAQGIRTAHFACLRMRAPVPVKFDDFASALTEWDDITDDETPDTEGVSDLDPTQSGASVP